MSIADTGAHRLPPDEQLVARLRTGDMAALETVYDRYGAALNTFAYSMLHSRERADDATHDAFLIAVARIGQLRDPSRLRPWLYAIVRSECLRSLRGTKRETPFQDWHDEGTDDDTGRDLHRTEVAALVREAMGGLSPKDREIVELSLRHDLDNGEIAAVLNVKPSHVTALTSRARKSLEQSLGTLLVARAGGEGCPDLTELLAPWDGEFTPLWRKRIAKHVDNCPSCTGERRRRFTPAAILVTLPMMAVPVGLRLRTLHDAQPALVAYQRAFPPDGGSGTTLPEPVTGGGRPPSAAAKGNPPTEIDGAPAWDYPLAERPRTRMMWLSGAAVMLLLAGVIWFVVGPLQHDDSVPVRVVKASSSPAPSTERSQRPITLEPTQAPQAPAEEPITIPEPEVVRPEISSSPGGSSPEVVNPEIVDPPPDESGTPVPDPHSGPCYVRIC